MTFWDRFILRLYYTLAEGYPHGPDSAVRLLNLAHGLGLINPAAVSDLSILLLKAILPPANPLRQPVEQEFQRRGLHLLPRPQLWGLLVASAPRRDLEILELGRHGTPHQRGLALDIILRLYLPSLRQFLGRLYLVDPNTFDAFVIGRLMWVMLSYYRIPPGTIGFLCLLYRHVLGALPAIAGRSPPGPVLPGGWPAGVAQIPPALWPFLPVPPWLATLVPAEQRFLQCCHTVLAPGDRVLVYLSFYAELNLQQITCVLRGWQTVTGDQVVTAITHCWERLLNCLAGPP